MYKIKGTVREMGELAERRKEAIERETRAYHNSQIRLGVSFEHFYRYNATQLLIIKYYQYMYYQVKSVYYTSIYKLNHSIEHKW